MDRRAKVSSIIAVTATLVAGGAAVLATTAAVDAVSQTGAPGTARLVDDTSRSSVSDGQPASNPSPEVAKVAPETSDSGRTFMVASASTPAATPSASGSTSAQQGRSEAEPGAPESDPTPRPTSPPRTSPPPTPPTSPPAVDDPPPSTPPGTIDCHGSDDGLTEAQKKAREAACHHEDGDD
jgi:hypothetical protein